MDFKFHTSRIFTFSVMNHLWKLFSDTLSSLAFQTDSNADKFWSNSSSEEQSTRPHNFLSLFCKPNISSSVPHANNALISGFSVTKQLQNDNRFSHLSSGALTEDLKIQELVQSTGFLI